MKTKIFLTPRHKAILELRLKGLSLLGICKELSLPYSSVQKSIISIKERFNSPELNEKLFRCDQRFIHDKITPKSLNKGVIEINNLKNTSDTS